MANKYGVTFSEEDQKKFALMESFGVPMGSLKQIIDLKPADRKNVQQPGIPKDSLDNQLADWVQNARIANIELHDKELELAIKGDAKEEYPAIRKVMDILQDQKINSFSLVTGLRGKEK
jgi:biopolymer transport protein ExbD